MGEELTLDKRQLLLRHIDGDKAAFTELVALYRAPIYSYLVRSGIDNAGCDDLFQEIFIKIHNAALTYDSRRSLNPWVFTIVANTVRSHFRKQRVRKLVYGKKHDEEQTEIDEQAIDGYDRAEAQETAAWLEEEIKKLPLAQREVVVLCLVEYMPQKDVAMALEIPLSTVKTHLRRARMTLTKALQRRTALAERETAS